MAEKSRFNGTGRRKSSVARVTLTSPGKGSIEVNDEKWNNRDAHPGFECGEFFKENKGVV